jgi:hypothetical protein
VVGIDSMVLKRRVEELQAEKKSEAMDTKIRQIDEYLETDTMTTLLMQQRMV